MDIFSYLFGTKKASGGGGGSTADFEYETGTWTTDENIANAIVSFSKTHEEPPTFFVFADGEDTYDSNVDIGVGCIYVSNYDFLGTGATPKSSVSKSLKAFILCKYKSNATTYGNKTYEVLYPTSQSGSSAYDYARYWVNESYFKAYTGSDTKYWHTGRTYKWYAIWKK